MYSIDMEMSDCFTTATCHRAIQRSFGYLTESLARYLLNLLTAIYWLCARVTIARTVLEDI
jgi:hypothetical protein